MDKMTPQELLYVSRALARHIHFHFHDDAVATYEAAKITWVEWDDLLRLALPPDASIIIPIVPSELIKPVTWTVPFRGTTVTFWNRLPLPEGWQCDDANSPLWYRSPQGHFMPAWDLVGTAFDLLTMQEERVSGCRDPMGRSVARMSPRHADGRLQVPFINNSAAVLIDHCLRQDCGGDASAVSFAKPVSVCLSHDLDQLRGDDFWTQAARFWRFLLPLRRFRAPNFSALGHVFVNLLQPRKFFMDDLLAMVSAEKSHGFRSINYVLCGKRGRFGARTKFSMIGRYLREVFLDCDIGIHYNHGTLGYAELFNQQKKDINTLTSIVPVAGRAHYLQIDPQTSFQFWESQGIQIDESLGYPDAVGYRAAIAGPFKPFDESRQREGAIISLPLIAMDSAIAGQFGQAYADEIEMLVQHLSVVGGTFTLLFHPGMFANPEHPETQGMYKRILTILEKYNAVSKTAVEILADVKHIDAELQLKVGRHA